MGSAGFEDSNNRGSHLLLRAELDGLICSGATKGRDYTYILADGRVPETQDLTREASLERLARIYFTSHGPATLEDFAWWSGLSVKDARNALEMITPEFSSEEVDRQIYWFAVSATAPADAHKSVFLLPAYDEFLLGYKDRSASITAVDQKKAISSNGIFRPIIVVNGEVAGIWKRKVTRELAVMETSFFKKPGADILQQVEETAKQFAEFLGKGLEISHCWE